MISATGELSSDGAALAAARGHMPSDVIPDGRGAVEPGARALRSVTIALCIAVALLLWPMWPPVILAAWIARLGRPLLERFARALRGRNRAAGLLSLLVVLALVVPVLLLGAGLFAAGHDLVNTLAGSPSVRAALTRLTQRDGETAWPETSQLVPLLERLGSHGLGFVSDVAGAAASVLIGLFVFVTGIYVLLVQGEAAWTWVRARSPLRPIDADRLAGAFHETGRGLLIGVGLTTATQAVLSTIAYLALGVPRAWVLGPITGLASIIPVFGTALVWGPVAVGLYLDGSTGKAILLALLGLAVIGTIDNLLRPVYARYGALRMPMYLVFISAFGGLALLGPWGAILGPLVARLALEALSLRTP